MQKLNTLSHTGPLTLLHEWCEAVFISPEVQAETVQRAMELPRTG